MLAEKWLFRGLKWENLKKMARTQPKTFFAKKRFLWGYDVEKTLNSIKKTVIFSQKWLFRAKNYKNGQSRSKIGANGQFWKR